MILHVALNPQWMGLVMLYARGLVTTLSTIFQTHILSLKDEYIFILS